MGHLLLARAEFHFTLCLSLTSKVPWTSLGLRTERWVVGTAGSPQSCGWGLPPTGRVLRG